MKPSSEEDRARLLGLLRDQHSFPLAHRVQVIVRNDDTHVERVLDALAGQVTVEGEVLRHERQPSKNGTYVSLRIHVPVSEAEHVLAIYDRLGELPDLIHYF